MTRLKIERLSRGWTQAEVERRTRSKVRRWKISLAESGVLTLGRHEADLLAALFCIPSAVLLAELTTSNGHAEIGGKKRHD